MSEFFEKCCDEFKRYRNRTVTTATGVKPPPIENSGFLVRLAQRLGRRVDDTFRRTSGPCSFAEAPFLVRQIHRFQLELRMCVSPWCDEDLTPRF